MSAMAAPWPRNRYRASPVSLLQLLPHKRDLPARRNDRREALKQLRRGQQRVLIHVIRGTKGANGLAGLFLSVKGRVFGPTQRAAKRIHC